MSFTLTSQSVIRFESSTTRLGDEWQRTLMFFNVDISGGVHCDHRNDITAPRAQDRNGKRRNPGGGLSNPIMECAMPFGKPNEFYAQSRDDFDHRGSRPRRRSHGGRGKNSSYCDSRRPLQYRSTKPRWNHTDAAPLSYCPTKSSTHRRDFETANGYDEGYNNSSLKSYQNEVYQLPNQISRDLTYPEEERLSRDCYDTEFYTDSSYESPPDYYPNERPEWGSYQRSYKIPTYRNCTPYYPEELSCQESLSQVNIFRPRGKHRQTSGSMLPEYPFDCNDSYDRYKEPKNSNYEDRYEDSQPPSEFGRKVRYSKRFGYEDYGEKRLRSSPLSPPKPKAKIRKECRTPYRAYRDKGFSISQSRNYKTETDRFRNTDSPDKVSRQSHEHGIRSKEPERRHRSRSKESESCRRNRSRRHSHLEKVSPYGSPFKRAREASAQYDRISKQILGRTPDKRRFNFIVEEIPQPYKKYIKKEEPVCNFHFDINDEIPRHQRKLVREPSVTFANISSSKMYDNHEQKTYLKTSANKNKLFDFGSEIPYRLWKNAASSPMLIAFEIPYKKKDRPRDLKSDSDNDCYAVPYSSSVAKLKREELKKSNGPRVSLYDIKKQLSPKSIKQKISGFMKMSKKFHKRSNIFKDIMKLAKNQSHDGKENGKSRSASNLPKSRTRSASQGSKKKSTFGQKPSNLTDPSQNNKAKRCLSKIGTGSHYPTVFRGKCRDEENEEYSTCNIFCSSRCSKCDHGDRISSGNCSLNNDAKKNEPIIQSEESLTGSIKIQPSRANFSHASCNNCSDSESESSCLSISIQASVRENEFKNVRFSPAPSICPSLSSTSSSSQNSCTQGMIYSKTALNNRQNIETCSKPPIIRKSTSSELGCNCPRRRVYPKWSLTQKSNPPPKMNCACTCRPARLGLCLPSNIEMRSRPPAVVPIESNKKSSLKGANNRLERPSNRRVCLQITSSSSSQSKSSSGKSTTNSDETSCPSGKGITVSDKSSCSSEENIPIPVCKAPRKIEKPRCQKSQHNIGKIEPKPRPSCTSGKSIKTHDKSSGKSGVISLCCNAKREIDNIEKPNSKKTQCNIGNLCEERKLKVELISSSSVKSIKIIDTSPDSSGKSSKICEISSTCNANREVDNMEEKPKSQCITENSAEEQKSELTLRPCQQENPSCTPPSTGFHCLPQFPSKCPCSTMSVCSRNLSQKNSKFGPEHMQLVCLPNCTCSPCFPNPNSGITNSLPPLPCEDSPEPIPGENLTSNWAEESTSGKSIVEELKRELLNTFTKQRDVQYQRANYRNAPHIMIFPCQTPRIINANQFYGPDSVVCWAACSKPPSPF